MIDYIYMNNVKTTNDLLDKFPTILDKESHKVNISSELFNNNINEFNNILNSYLDNAKEILYKFFEEPYRALIEFKYCKERDYYTPSGSKVNIIFSIDYPLSNPEEIGPILNLLDKEELNRRISEICKDDKDIGELSIEDIVNKSDKYNDIIIKYTNINFEPGSIEREDPLN